MIHKKKFSILRIVSSITKNISYYEIDGTTDNISKINKGAIALFEYEGTKFILKSPNENSRVGFPGYHELTITHADDDIFNNFALIMAIRPYTNIDFRTKPDLDEYCKYLIVQDAHFS